MHDEEKDLEKLNDDCGECQQDGPETVSAEGAQGAAEVEPGGEAGGTGGAGGEAAGENDPAVLRKMLAEQTSRADENYDRLIRLQADYDNFRRRTRQEKEEIYKYTSEKLVSALLPVLDNFDLALSAEGNSIESFKSGVQMIYKQLMDVLAAEGVAHIPAVGEQFDPLVHEAVLRAESDEHPDNTVIEELRRGYYLKDKVIRPSMVKVVKSL
ncbi:nucleotide exchange factor GrpE [Pelotomaculum propionicicum]|uniref:nucleotide exchange factor GrpE n=1 Tax=Pelotomaculum propionicicum TaxID=258475 RepID=UPI003B7C9E8A